MNPSNTFKKEDETVNILFCGDHRAEDGVLIVALSLLHHVKEPLNIYVLTMKTATETREYEPFSQKAADLLTQQLQSYNPQNTLHLIDCTELFNESQPSANMNSRFTPYSMLRLYVDLIPDMPDRLLYLDNDVICREPFDDFYYQDLTGVQVVGVLDHYGKWFFHHQMRMADYINSGILLLNLPEIKATNLFVKARRMIATRHMFMPDQAAINRLSHAKKIAPRRFNDNDAFITTPFFSTLPPAFVSSHGSIFSRSNHGRSATSIKICDCMNMMVCWKNISSLNLNYKEGQYVSTNSNFLYDQR